MEKQDNLAKIINEKDEIIINLVEKIKALEEKIQAGFAEPHSSSTLGWVGVGNVLWLVKQIWSGKKFESGTKFGYFKHL